MDYRFAPGSSFAGYTIDAPIGSGSVGETYRARRAGTRITIALKIAWPELAAAPGFAFAMQRQARILQRFRHPRLCTVLDSGISKGLPFWASEFVLGPRDEPFTLRDYLADRVDRGRMIEEDEVFITAKELIDTLAALHAFRDREECPNGLALGDLRPVNILMDAETKFRLCDLGLSALVRAATHSFPGSKTIGVGYMSPEVRGGEPPTPRSDVYSMGAIMYELLTGQKFSAEAEPPTEIRKGIKLGWDALLKRCLAENPNDRLADMVSLKKVVENLEQTTRAKTIVVAKQPKPAAGEAVVTADLAGQSTIAKPRTMMLRKVAPDAGNATSARPKTVFTKKAAASVPEEVAQAETVMFAKPVAKRDASIPKKPAKKNNGPWMAVGIAAVLVGGSVLAWYFTKNGGAAPAPSGSLAAVATNAPATLAAGQPFKITSFNVEMKWIPPAKALIGSDAAEVKAIEPNLPVGETHVLGYETAREVSLPNGFWMAETEVTIGQWKLFMAANADYKTSAERKGAAQTIRTNGEFAVVSGVNWSNPFPGDAVGDNLPVTCIVPSDMQAFCAWLTNHERDAGHISPAYSFRLPTEFEWEHACRGGAKKRTAYWWGSDAADGEGRINGADASFSQKYPGMQKYNFTWSDPYLLAAPVGASGEKGRNGYGLSDMLGNVWECVSRPTLPGQVYAWRGGSFAEGYTIVRTASVRHRYSDSPSVNAGFRLCLSK